MIDKLRHRIEKYGFGVCSYLGQKIGVRSSVVRKYFIYTSFIAIGSPVIIYLFMAFWVNIRSYLKKSRDLLLD